MKKCIVMLSGGLDSRLAVKIMQEKGFAVTALFFKLPFGTGCCNESCSFNFSQLQGVKLEIFDCTIGELFKEYLEIIRNPKHRRGTCMNPCVDCRIFMLRKAKEFADENEIKFIATGEVEGQRPMSQMRKSLKLIEKKSGLKGRLLRPVSEIASGRRRDKQMALAKKFKISYPSPGGGCLLCEKELKKRFEFLFERGISEEEVRFVNVGRHFVIDTQGGHENLRAGGCWVVLGRDEKENQVLETLGKEVIVPDFPGPSALILDKCNEKVMAPKSVPSVDEDINTEGKKLDKLIEAYSKKGSLGDRKKFEKYKI